jgi:hypothetical protein
MGRPAAGGAQRRTDARGHLRGHVRRGRLVGTQVGEVATDLLVRRRGVVVGADVHR